MDQYCCYWSHSKELNIQHHIKWVFTHLKILSRRQGYIPMGEQKTGRRICWRSKARTGRRIYCHINYIFDPEKCQTPQWIVGVTRKTHLECELLLSFKYKCAKLPLKLFLRRRCMSKVTQRETFQEKGSRIGFGDGIKRLKYQFPMSNTMWCPLRPVFTKERSRNGT